MPGIEDILRDLDADETEGSEEEVTPVDDNVTIKAIRESQKQWEKKAKELARENKALVEFKKEVEDKTRLETVSSVFKELGLPDKQAELFLKTHEGEVTADNIKQFVQDYGLKDLSEETGGTTEDKSGGFTPGGVGGAAGGVKGVTREEWLKLVKTDVDRAQRLFAEGRVDLSEIEAMDNFPG